MLGLASTHVIADLLKIIIEMNLFQIASNKNKQKKKLCSLDTLVTYFPCKTAFSPLEVHGKIPNFWYLTLRYAYQTINSWKFHSYHIRPLSSVIQINSTVDLLAMC